MSSRIHAFEPQSRLAGEIAHLHPGVVVNNVALGETSGTLQLFDYAEHTGSQHASLLEGVIDGIHGGKVGMVSVAVTTVDDYCSVHSIAHIDLLKIDVEGFELKVLQGSERMLREGRIAMIQFEFNEMNVLSRVFLSDFFDILPGYRIHRLLPRGLLPLKRVYAFDAAWGFRVGVGQDVTRSAWYWHLRV